MVGEGRDRLGGEARVVTGTGEAAGGGESTKSMPDKDRSEFASSSCSRGKGNARSLSSKIYFFLAKPMHLFIN